MISLDSIYENIIAEIILLGISILFSKIAPGLMKKNRPVEKSNFNALNLVILLTLMSIMNLILNVSFWNIPTLTVFLTISSFGLSLATSYIYSNQCPNCKKFIGAKKRVDEKIIKEYSKDIFYQPLKVVKYSNGNIKSREPFGNKKTRHEKWQTKQYFYECNHCQNKWDSGQVDVPVFQEKEAHKVINTNERDPKDGVNW